MLLNTDLELAYDIDVDNEGSGTQCKIQKVVTPQHTCPIANTKSLVEKYANVS